MDKDIHYYEGAFTEAIRTIVNDALSHAPFNNETLMAATVEALKRDVGFLENTFLEMSKRELSAEESQQVIRDALKDWDRPCPRCEHNKGGGCSKWECVAEKQRIEDALANAQRKKVA